MAISTKLHLLPIPSLALNQGVMHESFIGDGHRDVFDLKEVPSSIGGMTAQIAPCLRHPMGMFMVVGDVNLNTFFQVNAFGQGYDALVDVLAQDLYLRNALPQGETLVVEYPFNASNQQPSPSAVVASAGPISIHATVPGWQDSDYADHRDLEAAMKADQQIDYAICQWLVRNEQAFLPDEYEKMYRFAREHCPRFDREQPRWR